MRTLVAVVVMVVASVTSAAAELVLTVSTPVPVREESPAHYALVQVEMRLWPDQRFAVELVGLNEARTQCARDTSGNCQVLRHVYSGPTARALINELGQADLTEDDLEERILTRLLADGALPAGEITGDPGIFTPTATPTNTPAATPTNTESPP